MIKHRYFSTSSTKETPVKLLLWYFILFFLNNSYLISTVVTVCLQEEIQQLKAKLEKVEKERNELRLNTDRLESKVRRRKQKRKELNTPSESLTNREGFCAVF